MKTLIHLLSIAALATTSAFADTKVKAVPRKGLLALPNFSSGSQRGSL